MKKRVLSLVMVFILVFSMVTYAAGEDSAATAAAVTSGTTNAAGGSAEKLIPIIHTNDVHARVQEDSTSIGYARLAGLIPVAVEGTGNDPILVDAGDAFHGQTIATLERGESIVNIMNKVGYDVMVPGNHDFNYGKDRLLELASKASFKIISANIKNADGTSFLEEYTIIERQGVKIGFFGLSTPETAYKTNPKNVEGLTFTDPVEAAQRMVTALKGKVDVIACVSHLGLDEASTVTSKTVAQKVQGIDLIIDGHSHTVLAEPLQVNGTRIFQTGEYLKNIGEVEIAVDASNKVTRVDGMLLPKERAAKLIANADVAATISGYAESQKAILSQVLLKSDIDFDGERQNVRTGPTNLSSLITAAMIDATGADAAITNGGGIRASIKAGNVTRGDIISVLPFGNYIVTKRMKGSDIRAALEHGLSQYHNPNGAFPQVANIEYRLDASKPAGARVTDIWIKGVALDPAREYIVATNDFMAAGGDGYAFKSLPLVNEYQALDEALISFVAKNPNLIRYDKYTIKKGDVLWRIARLFGHSWQELAKINNLKDANTIDAGDTLLIPAW